MSDLDLPPPEFAAIRRFVLDLSIAIVALMLVGIGVITLYIVVVVGSLASPGAQESFGLGLALAFTMAAVAVHVVDRMYRLWPMGRRVHPTPPGPVTPADEARLLKVIVLVGAAVGIAYLLGTLITG